MFSMYLLCVYIIEHLFMYIYIHTKETPESQRSTALAATSPRAQHRHDPVAHGGFGRVPNTLETGLAPFFFFFSPAEETRWTAEFL